MSLKSRLAASGWVTGFFLPLSGILMEVFWVIPWLTWMASIPTPSWPKPPLSLLSLVMLLGVSSFSTRFFLTRKRPGCWTRFGIFGCTGIAVALMIRAEYTGGLGLLNGAWFGYIGMRYLKSFSHFDQLIAATVVSFLLCWRGIRLGSSELSTTEVYRRFLFGIVALVVAILVSGATLGAGYLFSTTSVWGQIAGFFFFGLLALALANLETAQQKMSAEGNSPALTRRWLSILIVAIGGLVTAGIGIASLISRDFVNALTAALGSVSDFLFRILSYIFVSFGFLFEWVFRIGASIVALFAGEAPKPFGVDGTGEIRGNPETPTFEGLPPRMVETLKWLLLALIAAVLLYVLGRTIFRHIPSKETNNIDETHESLWSWDLFKSDLGRLFGKLRKRFDFTRQGQPGHLRPPDWILSDFSGQLTVRQIYRCLLWEASRMNLARRDCETPNEYARRLAGSVPDGRKLIEEITGLYVGKRYGGLDALAGGLERANEMWRSLRTLLHEPEGQPSA
jgi:hypothetical protein